MQRLKSHTLRGRISSVLGSAACAVLVAWSSGAGASAPPQITISQVPMTVAIPAHPQILLAVANSQSMDGNLSGAIYTGSGSTSSPLLATSSSPVNFTIPSGFTPPVNAGSGGTAPYTVNSSGQLLDNSPSRLNVAKAAITSILNSYMVSADFALMDYSISGYSLYSWTTWVYQMSQPGGFTFTSTIPTASEYVANPCYGINITGTSAVAEDCKGLNTFYGASQGVTTQPYMVVAASSDDAAINDVLYAPAGDGIDPLCLEYGTVFPATPFPPYYTLASYNSDSVYESYPGWSSGSGCNYIYETGPTNAGYVPYSAQVMYEMRGFGYYTNGEQWTSGNIVVPMESSGATPTAASVATALAKFTPYLQPETNSTGTSEIKAATTQSPMAGVIATAKTFFAANPPTTNGCTTQRYVVLLTDGLPTQDLAGKSWPPLGSASAAGYGVWATFNAGTGALIVTNDQALTDVINNLTSLNSGSNPVKTYIVGLGAGINPTSVAGQTLTAMAVAGGTGAYFPASTPQAVTNDLEMIITTILAETESTASAAVNTTGLNVNSVVYQSQFVTSDTPYQDWTGNVFAFPISSTTGIVNTLPADAYWSAQTQLDAQTSRLLATWDPIRSAAIPFEWTTGSPVNGIGTSTVLGQDLETYTPDTNGQDVLQYLRGSTTQEVRNGGTFRNRSHILGDIVDSNPAYIGPSSENIQSASYLAFEASTATRPPILYIGANDGMLHGFDTVTGKERFAYLPRGAYANLINLASPYYNAQHRFFVNGSPEAGDVQFSDLSWHSLLVGAEAQGGNSVFALDVSNPVGITTESALAGAVLWDFTDTDMGLGFSNPVIASTNSGWQVLMGNGYNSTNEKAILYALNPQTGAINAKIDLCAAVTTACSTTAANGLSSLIAVNTSGQVTAAANLVYAGDLQGNLWRVDISNSNPALWVPTVLFQARDALNNRQPITTTPVATLNPKFPQVLGTMVLFGTGQFLGQPDVANENVQSVYGVYDPPAGYTTALTRSSLLQQTLATATLGSVQVRTISGTIPSIPTNKGWFIDLSLLSGERLINDPRLAPGGELILTTYQPIPPSFGQCTVQGSSYLMVLNYATGGSFSTPQFDANGDGVINSSDMVVPTGGTVAVAPVGVSLGNVYASAPTIRSGSFSSGGAVALVTETVQGGGTAIATYKVGTPSKSRTAWWEIRQ
jgi:type IV pilus assembly protein PilY1